LIENGIILVTGLGGHAVRARDNRPASADLVLTPPPEPLGIDIDIDRDKKESK
jgi:hypothetical protein